MNLKKIIPILIVILIAFLTWYKILFKLPIGEGYFYFSPENHLNFKMITIVSIFSSYSFFGQLIFAILIPIFRDNIPLYTYFQFAVMLIIYISFYYILLKIFKNKWIAIVSTIFFIANYVGQFTMIGQGDYQRFIQRVPELPFVFFSFLFLIHFLEKGKPKHIVFSISLYILALVLEHYTSFFLPFFVFLPIIYGLVNNKITLKRNIVTPLIFGLLTEVIIRSDRLSRSNYSIVNFALHTPNLIKMIAYQISMTGFPIQFTEFMAKHARPPVPLPYTGMMTPIFIIVILYLYLGFLKIRKDKKILSIYLTLILSVFAISFLIMYAYDAIPNPLINFGQDRIYFIHSIIFAIIWGIIIKALFSNLKNNTYQTLCILVCLVFLFQNLPPIWTGMDETTIHSEIIRKFLSSVKDLSPKFDKNTVIVAPWEPLTAIAVINDFYKIPPSNLVVWDKTWPDKVAKITQNRNNVYILDFKYSFNQDGTPNSNSVEIINQTDIYRRGEKVPPSKYE